MPRGDVQVAQVMHRDVVQEQGNQQVRGLPACGVQHSSSGGITSGRSCALRVVPSNVVLHVLGSQMDIISGMSCAFALRVDVVACFCCVACFGISGGHHQRYVMCMCFESGAKQCSSLFLLCCMFWDLSSVVCHVHVH
jgi:hypothetical protein